MPESGLRNRGSGKAPKRNGLRPAKQNPRGSDFLATLISADYLEEQKLLHRSPRGYGGKGSKWAPLVHQIATTWHPRTMLDYGCGQGTLAETLLRHHGVRCASYDPAVAKFCAEPEPADMVICTDVLEHVEPDRLVCVIDHLAGLTNTVLFAVISLVETEKKLSDGRQAHISLLDRETWRQLLELHFDVIEDYREWKPDKQAVYVLRKKKP